MEATGAAECSDSSLLSGYHGGPYDFRINCLCDSGGQTVVEELFMCHRRTGANKSLYTDIRHLSALACNNLRQAISGK